MCSPVSRCPPIPRLPSAIRRSVRPCDITVHLGGDELVILLPELGPEAAALERVRGASTQPRAR